MARGTVPLKLDFRNSGNQLLETVLVRSAGCRLKERGIHDHFIEKVKRDLGKLANSIKEGRLKNADTANVRLGKILQRYAPVAQWVEAKVQRRGNVVKKLNWQIKTEIEKAVRELEGCYLLRTNLKDPSAEKVLEMYSQLSQVEDAIRTTKHDLWIRPIFHWTSNRVEAHILMSMIAYAMGWVIQREHRAKGGTLTLREILRELRQIQCVLVSVQTTDGTVLKLRRVTKPNAQQAFILQTLGIIIPNTM